MKGRREELVRMIKAGLLPADLDINAELERTKVEKAERERLELWREFRDAYNRKVQANGRVIASPVQTEAIAGLVRRWRETHDKSFVETALEYCYVNDLPVLKPLLREMVAAIRQAQKGKATRPLREGIANQALAIVCNLVVSGVTLDRASEVAAVWSEKTAHRMKASTIAKRYSEEWRCSDPSLEQEFREHRERFETVEDDKVWWAIEESTPLPTPEQKGERR